MGTACGLAPAVQAALTEAIAPYCERPAKGGRPRPQRPQSDPRAPRLPERIWRHIGRDIMALHEGYTSRGADFSQAANPIHTRLPAYQLYFLPRNWWRVARVLDALPWDEVPPGGIPEGWMAPAGAGRVLELLDLGCGTGAFSLAWIARLASAAAGPPKGLTIRLTLVDQGRQLLQLAVANIQALARRVLPEVDVQCDLHADGVQAFLAQPPRRDTYAIAGGAMMLNELSLLGPRRVSERATGLTDALRARMRPGGCLLFVEPGTRRGYMNLMVVRDQLGSWPILHPCPHDEHCPMWGGAVKHWCHATEPLPRHFFFDDLLRERAGVRFEMRDVQVASLAVQAHGAPSFGAPFQRRAGERIVSAPMHPRPPRGAPLPPAAERVVLVCTPRAVLEERTAPQGLRSTRGVWWPREFPENPMG